MGVRRQRDRRPDVGGRRDLRWLRGLERLQANLVTIQGSIRPIREGRELVSDSEGEYGDEDVYVFTTTELRTRSPDNPDTESDIIMIPNTSGVLRKLADHRGQGRPHLYRGTATRLVLP